MDETYNIITKLIDDNKYIKKCKSNKKKDKHSLSYLINKSLSQSDCIKLGFGLEKIIKDIIIHFNKDLENIKPPNCKGEKEKDHLFIDNTNKIIYYAELKSNLNLDTEKCKSTSNKCLYITEELQKKYETFEIKMYLLCLRYYDITIIPRIIKNKYQCILKNLVGINNYFTELNIPIILTEDEYKKILNYIAHKMFD